MTFQKGNRKASRLTGEGVLDMREKYASGLWTQAALSRFFQVSISTVRNIVNGMTWQNVAYQPVIERQPPNIAIRSTDDSTIAASAAKALELAEAATRPNTPNISGSWYDQPPPTEDEDQAAAQRAQDALADRLRPTAREQQVSDELDKLVKGD